MLRIAYCDDRVEDRASIFQALAEIEKHWERTFVIEAFSRGEALCEDLKINQYDVILLDILMEGIDGIETANRIQAMGQEAFLIFISSYEARWKELFAFQPLAFLDKPLETNALADALEKAVKRIEKQWDGVFQYKKGREMKMVSVKDILYFESRRNEILIHKKEGTVSFYGTIGEVWEQVQEMKRFVMPHRSYIFNLSEIILRAETVILKKDNTLYNIGEKYKEDTRERYLRYMEKRCQG